MADTYLDTSVCVEFLSGRLRSGYRVMRSDGPATYKLPAIVVAELFASARQSSHPKQHFRLVEKFVEAFEIVPFDADCAREYSRIHDELQHQGRHGRLIGERDMMVAATALAHRGVLACCNARDFLRIPGLQVDAWSSE